MYFVGERKRKSCVWALLYTHLIRVPNPTHSWCFVNWVEVASIIVPVCPCRAGTAKPTNEHACWSSVSTSATAEFYILKLVHQGPGLFSLNFFLFQPLSQPNMVLFICPLVSFYTQVAGASTPTNHQTTAVRDTTQQYRKRKQEKQLARRHM